MIDLHASELSRLVIIGRDGAVLADVILPGDVLVQVAGQVRHIPKGCRRTVGPVDSGEYEIVRMGDTGQKRTKPHAAVRRAGHVAAALGVLAVVLTLLDSDHLSIADGPLLRAIRDAVRAGALIGAGWALGALHQSRRSGSL